MVGKNNKMHIRRGDLVEVLAGNDRGKQGKVQRVLPPTRQAVVEKINMRTHYVKPTQQQPKGGIIQKEAPIHASNLMVVDPSTQQRSRIGRRVEGGRRVRYAKKSRETITHA